MKRLHLAVGVSLLLALVGGGAFGQSLPGFTLTGENWIPGEMDARPANEQIRRHRHHYQPSAGGHADGGQEISPATVRSGVASGNRTTEVLLLRAKNPELLESKTDVDFPHSMAISELVGALENYFSMPVIDETGATNRYDRSIGRVPARWVNGRTTDLGANNTFLESFGLELVRAKRPQEWLVMEHVH